MPRPRNYDPCLDCGSTEGVYARGRCRIHYMENWRATTALEPEHGILSTYTNHHCRCTECRAANAQHQREVRLRKANKTNV